MNAEKPNGFRCGRAFIPLFLNNPCGFFHLSSDPSRWGLMQRWLGKAQVKFYSIFSKYCSTYTQPRCALWEH
jgi:hypothetical protein